MPTIFDKSFLDRMTGAERHKLADAILASAESGTMSLSELQHLTDGLTKLLSAEAEKRSAKNVRVAKIEAAKADPLMRPTIAFATGRLRALNMDINAAAAVADVGAIDKAMKERNWNIEQRIALKGALAKIGVID
jgi:hypothetical protein